VDWLNHPTRLANELRNSDVLIIDSYLAGKEFYEIFSKLSRVSLFIDDYMRIDYPNGIILNGTINSESLPYPKKSGCDYLLGSNYAPIRKAFWDNPQRKYNQKVSSALITFGAQDVKNLTPQIANAVHQVFPDWKKSIVFGNVTTPSREIEALKNDMTEIHFSVDAESMKNMMLASDITISAAGQTLYELAVTGTPTAAVSVVENQRFNILEWKKAGFLSDSIFYNDHNFIRKIIDLADNMQSISQRKKLGAAGKKRVDGQGSRRVIEFILNKIH
jgi:spore coat polysaccharide biosynthesis predicted glycosyltransferase SpsG